MRDTTGIRNWRGLILPMILVAFMFSILVMGVVGGGIIPLVLGWLKDLLSYQQAYWMLIPIYLYLLYYATRGHRIRRHAVNLN